MSTTATISGIVRLYPERFEAPPRWLLTMQRDLARDTAESAFTELFANPDTTAAIVHRVLDRLIDRMAGLMRTAYEELGIRDPSAIASLRQSLGLAFLERFDELTGQMERGGLA